MSNHIHLFSSAHPQFCLWPDSRTLDIKSFRDKFNFCSCRWGARLDKVVSSDKLRRNTGKGTPVTPEIVWMHMVNTFRVWFSCSPAVGSSRGEGRWDGGQRGWAGWWLIWLGARGYNRKKAETIFAKGKTCRLAPLPPGRVWARAYPCTCATIPPPSPTFA